MINLFRVRCVSNGTSIAEDEKIKSNIWLNQLDEKKYKGSRFSLDYVDHLGGYAVGYVAFLFAIIYIIEFLFD